MNSPVSRLSYEVMALLMNPMVSSRPYSLCWKLSSALALSRAPAWSHPAGFRGHKMVERSREVSATRKKLWGREIWEGTVPGWTATAKFGLAENAILLFPVKWWWSHRHRQRHTSEQSCKWSDGNFNKSVREAVLPNRVLRWRLNDGFTC